MRHLARPFRWASGIAVALLVASPLAAAAAAGRGADLGEAFAQGAAARDEALRILFSPLLPDRNPLHDASAALEGHADRVAFDAMDEAIAAQYALVDLAEHLVRG